MSSQVSYKREGDLMQTHKEKDNMKMELREKSKFWLKETEEKIRLDR